MQSRHCGSAEVHQHAPDPTRGFSQPDVIAIRLASFISFIFLSPGTEYRPHGASFRQARDAIHPSPAERVQIDSGASPETGFPHGWGLEVGDPNPRPFSPDFAYPYKDIIP